MDTISYSISHNMKYYMRNAYRGNAKMVNTDYRSAQDKGVIVSADAKAVGRMTSKLQNLEYDTDHGVEVLQNTKAFVETYNNLIDSSGESKDSHLSSLTKKMKKLIKSKKDDLESIGIELKSNGKLKLDEDTFSESRPEKIKRILNGDDSVSVSLRSIVNKIYRASSKMTVYSASGEKTAQDVSDSGNSVDLSL